MEPVDACAVCDGRELTAPDPEGAADRREAEHDLELLPDPVDEELPANHKKSKKKKNKKKKERSRSVMKNLNVFICFNL